MSKSSIKYENSHFNNSIVKIIEGNSRILDLGCGTGELLQILKHKKNVKGVGIDINQDNIICCLEKGLSAIQGDVDEGLKEFTDKSYDYVVLNQTLQSTHHPEYVLQEMLRVGKKCIISFPNFAYWRIRCHLFFKGQMPKSRILPFEWYDTPNIHLLTVHDFFEFAKKYNMNISEKIYFTNGKVKKFPLTRFLPNLLSEEVIFVISGK